MKKIDLCGSDVRDTKMLWRLSTLPVLLGAVIYVAWREDTLLVFLWFEALGLTSLIASIRDILAFYNPAHWSYVGSLLVYSTPGGLWSMSFVAAMGHTPSRFRWLGVSLAGLGGVLSEYGQYFQLLPGHFDLADVFFYLLGVFLGVIFLRVIER
jgi:hypothetical protein